MVYLQIVRIGLNNLLWTEAASLKPLPKLTNDYLATNDYLSKQPFAAKGDANETLVSHILSQIRPT
jgi:hypothetical protein